MKLPFSSLKSSFYERVIAIAQSLCQPAILAAAALFFAVHTMDVLAGAIYKSVDKDGNVIFTDQPLDGAKSLNKEAENNSTAAQVPEGENQRGGGSESEGGESTPSPVDEDSGTEGLLVAPQPKNPPKTNYKAPEEPTRFLPVTTIEILTPIHDATLHDPLGKIWVELQSYPTPMKDSGLTAQLWMDDRLITSGKRPMLSLPAPERGTHVLQVKLVDDKGRLFLSSKTVHIHVKYRVAGQ